MTAPSYTLTDAERLRVEYIDRLVAVGAGGVTELLSMLEDPSWTVRRAAIAGLAALGDDAAGPLCAWLAGARTSEDAIAAAVDALARSIGTTVNRRVSELTGHAHPAVVSDAAQILGRRHAVEAAPVLARLVDHADHNVAMAAIEALGALGGAIAVEPLLAVLERRTFFLTFPAMQVLARSGDPRVVAPIARLLDDDAYRVEALRALGRTGAVQATAPLASLLRAPVGDVVVRHVAVALAELAGRADWLGAGAEVTRAMREALGPSIDRLVAAIPDADPAERAAIATVLGRAGGADAVPALVPLLAEDETATAAMEAIHRLGRASDGALAAALEDGDPRTRAALLGLVSSPGNAAQVRGLLEDPDAEVRASACDALARLGDTAAVDRLFAALADASPRVAHAAAAAIQALGAAETERLAIAAVRSPALSVRRHALRIVAYFGWPGALPAVSEALDDRDERIAELAAVALGTIDDPAVDDLLDRVAAHPSARLRAAAMRAAGQRGGARAAAVLERGLGDPDAWVRYYACLGTGHAAFAALASRLVAATDDPAPQVRVAAIEAMSRLDTREAWAALVAAASAEDDADRRRAALVGLGQRLQPEALPLLLGAARTGDAPTRLVALAGLARARDPAALHAVTAACLDASPAIRDGALSLLAEREDAPAAAALVECALRVDPEHPVHLALSRPGDARVDAIVARLASADERSAGVLAAALARMHDEAGAAALVAATTLPNPAVRRAAAVALSGLDPARARPAVERLAYSDPDPEVRRVCIAALARP